MSDFSRRTIVKCAVASGLLGIAPRAYSAGYFSSKRPPLGERRFVSRAVEAEIDRIKGRIGNPKLSWMFENCYPNTLDTTVTLSNIEGNPDAFVITGDIDALWLRDSSAQLNPYVHLVGRDAALRELFRGLIGRHARSILIDPYANAFMRDPNARTNLVWALEDQTEMAPGVAERKWEIDSLCYTMRLAHRYWVHSHDKTPFDSEWADAVRLVLATFRTQQRKKGPGPYKFQRKSDAPTETLATGGIGAPSKPNGLIHSGFRPSDDACLLPLFIPANLFAVASLRKIAVVLRQARGDNALAAQCEALAAEVEAAAYRHGRMRDELGREIWAYETDGFGNAIFMDDANVPSISGLAYLGAVKRNDPVWRRSAARAWSRANPYYFSGKAAEGIGGPHVGLDMIWPMSIMMRALNSDSDAVIRHCLAQLMASEANTGFMHEAFDKDDPAKFTRSWFAWANGLFGELIIDLERRKPHLLKA